MGFWIKEKQEYRRVFLLKGVPIRFPNVDGLGDPSTPATPALGMTT